jgi:hypothetical protein
MMRASLCPVKLSMGLDEIVLQLRMQDGLFNLAICFKKCMDAIGVPLRSHSAINIIKQEFQA